MEDVKTEMTAIQLVLDALLTNLELLAESFEDSRIDDLINHLDEANCIAEELKKATTA